MISEKGERPVACWRSKERYNGEILECLTIVFSTSGCTWNRCLMCGYRHERYFTDKQGTDEKRHLMAQLAWVLERYKKEQYQMVKIFTSGSFFNPAEVPPSVQLDIAAAFKGKVIIAETRPEFVTEEAITTFVGTVADGTWETPLYCAIGVETSDDFIREKCIQKGFLFSDFTGACTRARSCGAGVKAYLLLKPLFMTELEAVRDMISSIRNLSGYADLISMNPCTVQARTELEWFWRQGAYRPPYLWSVLTVLQDSPFYINCDPVGGGRKRGPHNCGLCDPVIVQGIRDYSLTSDKELIRSLLDIECKCKAEWRHVMDQEMPFCMPLTR